MVHTKKSLKNSQPSVQIQKPNFLFSAFPDSLFHKTDSVKGGSKDVTYTGHLIPSALEVNQNYPIFWQNFKFFFHIV